ncbi:DUF4810 domain-containing protein [Massilia sp. GCM10023247]|uniref:DUF4810 domain-containing protein n=1 Tax=Massilia sp. GCM10023247 TaxID=3252643 RepID=UPI00360833D7
MKKLLIAAALLALTGCATKGGLYEWGGYDGLLYQSYKNPEATAKSRESLAAHIAVLEKGGKRVAPGLHADLGTLLLQSGDKAGALSNFRRERELWPESAVLMDAMIKNLETTKSKEVQS